MAQSKPLTNSAAGDALARIAAPGLAAAAKVMTPKKPPPLPTMDEHADALHPVNVTPNRVTGEYSK